MFPKDLYLMLLQAALIPTVTVGGGNSMPGCFTHEGGVVITEGQLFLWELIMTFVLVSTVYAVAVTKPGHGNIGPLAVGFSLFASAFIGESSWQQHCIMLIVWKFLAQSYIHPQQSSRCTCCR